MPGTRPTPDPVDPPVLRRRQLQRPREQMNAAISDGAALATVASRGQGERLLRLREVMTIVGMSRAHVYNLIKQELFPPPIALGSNCSRWVHSEVQTWVYSSIEAARAAVPERRLRKVRAR